MLPPSPIDKASPGRFSSSVTAENHPACRPGSQHSSAYGRFSVAHSDTQPVYSVNSFLPGMPPVRDLFPSGRFGLGVSSAGQVPRNLSLHNQAAMTPSFTPCPSGSQELAGPGMGAAYLPFYWTATPGNTPGNTVDAGMRRCQPVSPIVTECKADTSIPHSRLPGPKYKGVKERTVFPDWKVQQLNNAFRRGQYLSSESKSELAARLQIKEEQVKVWFQNKRAKAKRWVPSKNGSNCVQSLSPSRSKLISQALRARQQMSSDSGIGGKQRYTLQCERAVVSRTMAISPIDALQQMLVKERTPYVRSSSVTESSQSRSPEPESPASGELAKSDSESDSSRAN